MNVEVLVLIAVVDAIIFAITGDGAVCSVRFSAEVVIGTCLNATSV